MTNRLHVFKIVLFSTFFILFNNSNLYSSTWYVDKDATGSNSGTSWDNAWISMASISVASSGDVVFISGGVTTKTYTNSILRPPAGVTVKPGAAEASALLQHSGQIILNRTGQAQAITCGGNNVKFDFLVNNARKLKVIGGTTGVECSNSGLLFRGIELTGQVSYGMQNTDATGEVDNVYIHGSTGTSYDAAIKNGYNVYTPGYDRMIIHDSEIAVPHGTGHTGFGADGVQGGSGLTMYNNLIYGVDDATYSNGPSGQHQDGVQTGGGAYQKIYNNIFHSIIGQGIFLEYSYLNLYVYNNVLWNVTYPIPIGRSTSTRSNVHVESNTIVDCDAISGAPVINIAPATTVTNITIKNNIIAGCGTGGLIQYDSYGTGGGTCGVDIVIDGNVTSGTTGTGTSCKGATLTQPTYGSKLLPSFISYSPATIHRSIQPNLRLSSGDTVAKDHGITSIYFTTDKNGVPRPQGLTWDIGAYEFTGKNPKYPGEISIGN